MPGFLHADDLVLRGESEEDLKAMRDVFLRSKGKEVLKSIHVRPK